MIVVIAILVIIYCIVIDIATTIIVLTHGLLKTDRDPTIR